MAQSALSVALNALSSSNSSLPENVSSVSPPSLVASAPDSDSLDDDVTLECASPFSLSFSRSSISIPSAKKPRSVSFNAHRGSSHSGHSGHSIKHTHSPVASFPNSTTSSLLKSVRGHPINIISRSLVAEILLSQGPLAIRHLTAQLCLSSSVFAEMSLGKQRRVIVHILESPPASSDEEEFMFEKVGWGRWAASRHGLENNNESKAMARLLQYGMPSSCIGKVASSSSSSLPRIPISPGLLPVDDIDNGRFYAMESSLRNNSISNTQGGIRIQNENPRRRGSSVVTTTNFSSFEGDLIFSSSFDDQDNDIDILRRGNKMEDVDMEDDVDLDIDYKNDTDEEDWRSVGAESLRKGNLFHSLRPGDESGGASHVFPLEVAESKSTKISSKVLSVENSKLSELKEAEAIQALVQLGSV